LKGSGSPEWQRVGTQTVTLLSLISIPEPPEPTIPFLAIVIALVLGALLMGAVMTFLIWKRRTRGKKGSWS
jgi:hypothetical protein